MSRLTIVPIALKAAKRFVGEHHRHNKPPVGHKFSIGVCTDDGELVGVATVGRPVAAALDDLPPRKNWAESSVALRAIRDAEEPSGVARSRWERSA